MAITSTLAPVLVDPGPPALLDEPKYNREELTWIKTLPVIQCLGGWWRAADSEVTLPKQLGLQNLRRIHWASHVGTHQMPDLLRYSKVKIKNGNQIIEDLVNSCQGCQVTNANSNPKNPRKRPGVC